MNLTTAEEGKEYIIQRIETDDEDLNAFLFSLGCYSGEPVTVVSPQKGRLHRFHQGRQIQHRRSVGRSHYYLMGKAEKTIR